MSISARIQQARKAAGLSQARLAELLGVTRSACSQWESAGGTAPRQKRLEQLAGLLGVSYEWLATGRKSREETTAYLVREEGRSAYHPTLAADEEELLKFYRALPAKKRKAWLEFLRSL